MNLGHSAIGDAPLGSLPGGVFANTIDITATVPVVAAQDIVQATVQTTIAAIPVTADMSLDFSSPNIDIDVVAAIPVVAASDLAHGVALDSVAAIQLTAEILADHGVLVAASAVIEVTALQDLAHGVALDGIAVIQLVGHADILIERYELRGEVRLGGVLVNRRVRAYQRLSGAMVGEVDTVIGKFALHTGFEPFECYITPIDLDAGATDWSPPTANRIMSVLALDTA